MSAPCLDREVSERDAQRIDAGGIDTVRTSGSFVPPGLDSGHIANPVPNGTGADGGGNALDTRVTGGVVENRLGRIDGNDVLFGAVGPCEILGGDDRERLLGGSEADLLDGGHGSDDLDGGAGERWMHSGSGSDDI